MKRPDIEQKFVTTGDIARECGVSKPTVLRWIENGLLKSYTLPLGHNRVPLEEFTRFKKTLGLLSEKKEHPTKF
jgi:excisionase family DNA binding protein